MPKIYAVATLQATPSGGNSQDLNLFKTESGAIQSIKKALTDFAQGITGSGITPAGLDQRTWSRLGRF